MSRIMSALSDPKEADSSKHGHSGVSKISYFILCLIVILIPLLSTCTLVTFGMNKQLLNFTPQWSDEIFYWHQAATFRVAGFNGGYYTINEQPAAIPFFHFYSHGPVYPILIGTLGRIFGWKINYAPFWNIAFLTLALAWFITTVKPDRLQLLLIGLVMLTFWPIQLYMVTNMRVVIFSSIAIVIAAFFHKTISEPKNTTRLYLIMFCLTIGLMTLFQISWALLFLPYLLLIRKRIQLSLGQATTFALIVIVISYFIYDQIIAPYPYFTSDLMTALKVSWYQGLKVFIHHSANNIRNFFNPSHHPLWLMLRAQMLLVITGSSYLMWKQHNQEATVQESIVVLTNGGLLLLEAILFFDIFSWRDYRLFAPVLLMIIFLFVARKRFFLVTLMLLANLALLPSFLPTYNKLIRGAFPEDRTAVEAFSKQIVPVIKYDANKDGWYNTLLAPLPIAVNRLMLGVPAGIGISWFTNPDELSQIKSRYLLLDNKTYTAMKKHVGLEFKLSTTVGDLYINRSSECNK
ncbi:MAG: hypothetical protein JXI33_07380 [Candidatus Aminicenantes bacterium]|nr:hypothetical protein [Candidatus Aminicenantes bacterium]